MNRLLLAFGIVCLLQGLFAEPRPEFGLTNSIPASSKLGTVKTAVNSLSLEINNLNPITELTSGITKLVTTREKIESIIEAFHTKTTAVTDGYDSLVSATDGDINGAFAPFISGIEAALAYISGDGATIATDITNLGYTGIYDQLTDAFTRIAGGLSDLKMKTEAVKTAITAAFNSENSATVSEENLRQHVTLKLMYDLLNSATKVRTYLPLVKYIFQTVINNLITADDYVNNLKEVVDNDVSTVSTSFTTELEEITTEIEEAVATEFSDQNNDVIGIYSSFSGMTGILGAPKFEDLKTTITTLKGLFATTALDADTTAMETAFDQISTSVTGLITTLKNGISVTDSALINLLIDTLVGNDEYGRYCYNKYKDLVSGLFDLTFDAGWLCVDKEYARLEHLKNTLLLIIELLEYDYEDVTAQVGVCDSLGIASNSNVDDCVAALATFYADLFAATEDKIELVFQIATDEAVASENRLLICLQLSYLDTKVTQAAVITEGLTICGADGPTGTD